MIYDELMALPDITPGIDQRVEVRNGIKVVIPVFYSAGGALFTTDEDGAFHDADGKCWMVGRQDGRRVRREMEAR